MPTLLNGITSQIDAASADAARTLHDTADGRRQFVPHFTAADEAAGRLDPGVLTSAEKCIATLAYRKPKWTALGVGTFGGASSYVAAEVSATHPNIYFGPLNDDFTPGVVEIDRLFNSNERDIAEYFANAGSAYSPLMR